MYQTQNVNLNKRVGKDRVSLAGKAAPQDFPCASPSGNLLEQPCQPSENPVLPSSLTQINPILKETSPMAKQSLKRIGKHFQRKKTDGQTDIADSRLSPVACHLTVVATATAPDPAPANSPIINSRLIAKVISRISCFVKSQNKNKNQNIKNLDGGRDM